MHKTLAAHGALATLPLDSTRPLTPDQTARLATILNLQDAGQTLETLLNTASGFPVHIQLRGSTVTWVLTGKESDYPRDIDIYVKVESKKHYELKLKDPGQAVQAQCFAQSLSLTDRVMGTTWRLKMTHPQTTLVIPVEISFIPQSHKGQEISTLISPFSTPQEAVSIRIASGQPPELQTDCAPAIVSFATTHNLFCHPDPEKGRNTFQRMVLSQCRGRKPLPGIELLAIEASLQEYHLARKPPPQKNHRHPEPWEDKMLRFLNTHFPSFEHDSRNQAIKYILDRFCNLERDFNYKPLLEVFGFTGDYNPALRTTQKLETYKPLLLAAADSPDVIALLLKDMGIFCNQPDLTLDQALARLAPPAAAPAATASATPSTKSSPPPTSSAPASPKDESVSDSESETAFKPSNPNHGKRKKKKNKAKATTAQAAADPVTSSSTLPSCSQAALPTTEASATGPESPPEVIHTRKPRKHNPTATPKAKGAQAATRNWPKLASENPDKFLAAIAEITPEARAQILGAVDAAGTTILIRAGIANQKEFILKLVKYPECALNHRDNSGMNLADHLTVSNLSLVYTLVKQGHPLDLTHHRAHLLTLSAKEAREMKKPREAIPEFFTQNLGVSLFRLELLALPQTPACYLTATKVGYPNMVLDLCQQAVVPTPEIIATLCHHYATTQISLSAKLDIEDCLGIIFTHFPELKPRDFPWSLGDQSNNFAQTIRALDAQRPTLIPPEKQDIAVQQLHGTLIQTDVPNVLAWRWDHAIPLLFQCLSLLEGLKEAPHLSTETRTNILTWVAHIAAFFEPTIASWILPRDKKTPPTQAFLLKLQDLLSELAALKGLRFHAKVQGLLPYVDPSNLTLLQTTLAEIHTRYLDNPSQARFEALQAYLSTIVLPHQASTKLSPKPSSICTTLIILMDLARTCEEIRQGTPPEAAHQVSPKLPWAMAQTALLIACNTNYQTLITNPEEFTAFCSRITAKKLHVPSYWIRKLLGFPISPEDHLLLQTGMS